MSEDEIEDPLDGMEPLPVVNVRARFTCDRCPVDGGNVVKTMRGATRLREGSYGPGVDGAPEEVHLCPMYKFDPDGFCVYENAGLELPKLTGRRAWFDTLGIVAHDVIRTYDTMGRMYEAIGNGKAVMQIAGLKGKFINQLFLGYRAGFMDQIQEREENEILDKQQILHQLMRVLSDLAAGGMEIPIEMVARALQGTEANVPPAITAAPPVLDDDPPGDDDDPNSAAAPAAA